MLYAAVMHQLMTDCKLYKSVNCISFLAVVFIGNSVRGVRFCEEFARHFNFHVYDNLRHSRQKSDPRTCKIPITVRTSVLILIA